MSNFQTSEDIIKFYKDGDGDNVFIFSPFYPFSNKLIKKFFFNLNISNFQFIYTSIVCSKNLRIDLYNYSNFINLFSKVIKLLHPKKIHLVCFGIFTNLFVEVANLFKDKIQSIVLFEPDFSDNIFSKLFDLKNPPVFKYKYILNYFFENNKHKRINKDYLIKIKIECLKFYYKSINNINKDYHLRDLIDYLPDEISSNIFNNKLLNKIEKKKDKIFILRNFVKGKHKYLLKKSKLQENEKFKIKQIMKEQDILLKVIIFWKNMAKESWPLAQIFEDYKISVNLMNFNIYRSFYEEDKELIFALKKIYKGHG